MQDNNQNPVQNGIVTPTNQTNQPPAPLQVPQSISISPNGQNTGSTQQPPQKSKKWLVVLLVLLLLAGASVAAYITLLAKDQASTNNEQTPQQESSILGEIDAEYANKKVLDGEFVDSGRVYVVINDDNVYSALKDTKPNYKYVIGDVVDNNNFDCSKEPIKNIETKFSVKGYKTVTGEAYSGGFGCTRVMIATNESESCSVTIEVDQKEQGLNIYNYIMTTSCASLSELKDKINQLQEVSQLQEDMSGKRLEGVEMYVSIVKVKDSVNDGYRIAILENPFGYNYYYKNGMEKWKAVDTSDSGFISCKQSGTDAKDILAAFEGETCDSYNSGKSISN